MFARKRLYTVFDAPPLRARQVVEPTTRIDVAPFTGRRRFMARTRLAIRDTNKSLLLLLLCLPVAVWGAVIASTLRSVWVGALIPAFHLFAPLYLTIGTVIAVVSGLRAAREAYLACLLLVAASYAVAALW